MLWLGGHFDPDSFSVDQIKQGIIKTVQIPLSLIKISYLCYMSSKEQILLDRIIGVVSRTAPDAELYLYGSRARQDAKKASDWDLLILLNAKNISFGIETKFMDEFYDLEVETGEIISPLIYTKTDWDENHSITPLFENIQREGIRIK